MSVDPKKAGKCWSCKYCEDIGEFTYEDYKSCMRKCTKSGHDYVDSCVSYCNDYVWDGKTPENSSSSSSSSYSSSSSKSSSPYADTSVWEDLGGCLIGIIVIGLIGGIILLAINFLPSLFDGDSDEKSESSEITSSVEEEYLNTLCKITTKRNDLGLRAEPSLESEPFKMMPKGSKVTLLKIEGEFAYVEYEGERGWCTAKYVTEIESSTAKETESAKKK